MRLLRTILVLLLCLAARGEEAEIVATEGLVPVAGELETSLASLGQGEHLGRHVCLVGGRGYRVAARPSCPWVPPAGCLGDDADCLAAAGHMEASRRTDAAAPDKPQQQTPQLPLAAPHQAPPPPAEQPLPPITPPEEEQPLLGHDERNFALEKDGAKVLAANREAKKVGALLDDDSDTYLKNECRADKWIIVELSELGKVSKIELAQVRGQACTCWSACIALRRVFGCVSRLHSKRWLPVTNPCVRTAFGCYSTAGSSLRASPTTLFAPCSLSSTRHV